MKVFEVSHPCLLGCFILELMVKQNIIMTDSMKCVRTCEIQKVGWEKDMGTR